MFVYLSTIKTEARSSVQFGESNESNNLFRFIMKKRPNEPIHNWFELPHRYWLEKGVFSYFLVAGKQLSYSHADVSSDSFS